MAKRERGEARSFAEFVADLSGGEVDAVLSNAKLELGNALQDVSLDARTKAKGEMTVKFKFTCDERGLVTVDVDHTLKKPKRKPASSVGWMDKDGNVVFEPPRQQKLPLQEVGGGRGELREVGGRAELREVPSNNNGHREA